MATVQWFGDTIEGNIKRAAMRGVVWGTEKVAETAAQKMQKGTKSGRIYTRRGKTWQASAPGEAPATPTGTLLRSMQSLYDLRELSGTVNWSTNYAKALEYGTSRMEPRPYARVSLEENRKKINERIRSEIDKVIKG